MDLEEKTLDIITGLYDKKHLLRTDVQFFIDLMRDYISNTYNPFLHQQLKKYLKNAISTVTSLSHPLNKN